MSPSSAYPSSSPTPSPARIAHARHRRAPHPPLVGARPDALLLSGTLACSAGALVLALAAGTLGLLAVTTLALGALGAQIICLAHPRRWGA